MNRIVVTGDEILALALCLIFSDELEVFFYGRNCSNGFPVLTYPDIELLESGWWSVNGASDCLLPAKVADLIEPHLQKKQALLPAGNYPDFENISGDRCRQLEPSLSGFFSRGQLLDSFYLADRLQLKKNLLEALRQTDVEIMKKNSFAVKEAGQAELTVVVINSKQSLPEEITGGLRPCQEIKKIYSSVELPRHFFEFTPVLHGDSELIPYGGRLFISKKIKDCGTDGVFAGEVLSLLHGTYEICPFIYEQSFAPPAQEKCFCGIDGGPFFAALSRPAGEFLLLAPGYQRGIWMLSYIVNLCRSWLHGQDKF
ncbi:MAG: hypothetical protein ACLFN5_03395 [bacterium]